MNAITLPPRSDGQPAIVLQSSRQITIIGANGAGKSRFCNQLVKSLGNKAFRISALRAMFPQDVARQDILPGSIDDRFERLNALSPQVKNTSVNEFDRLTYVMLIDEFHDLMNYKAHLLMNEPIEFPKTKLDTVVRVWQEVFPRNKVLRENGRLLFSTEGHDDTYSALRLSDGEKAVLYYIGAVLYAMPDAAIIVDDPEVFIHSSIMRTLWNVIEEMRPDCTFIYNTHDVDFASSRVDNQCVWVKSFDPEHLTWDYEVMPSSQDLDDALYYELLGSRKPVLFLEGDETHSLDGRLYPLIFTDHTVKPLGSCNRVIEAVRSFNALNGLHHLDSWGIVDRDRRSLQEVDYLRKKKILVPEVAEVENLFLLEGVIKAVAAHRHKKPDEVFAKVRHSIEAMFSHDVKIQALEHVRHMVKHEAEMRVDRKFTNITALEDHLVDLVKEINPRAAYEARCRDFRRYVAQHDYNAILRVYNQKQMLGNSNVAALCGLQRKEDYIKCVLTILKGRSPEAQQIRETIRACFEVDKLGFDSQI